MTILLLPVRFFIDLIRLGDAMEAATDRLDRNYRVAKSFQELLTELKVGCGSYYNPELVDLIVKDKDLRADLEYLLETGRRRWMLRDWMRQRDRMRRTVCHS